MLNYLTYFDKLLVEGARLWDISWEKSLVHFSDYVFCGSFVYIGKPGFAVWTCPEEHFRWASESLCAEGAHFERPRESFAVQHIAGSSRSINLVSTHRSRDKHG